MNLNLTNINTWTFGGDNVRVMCQATYYKCTRRFIDITWLTIWKVQIIDIYFQ